MWPLSGRTHQLRRHAAEGLNAPILGDMRYGGRARPLSIAGEVLQNGGTCTGEEDASAPCCDERGHVNDRVGRPDTHGSPDTAGSSKGAQNSNEDDVNESDALDGVAEEAGKRTESNTLLCLWAVELRLDHPVHGADQQLHFQIPVPHVLLDAMDLEQLPITNVK